MKIAALDLGTNSFLCLIAETNSSGEIKVLHDEMVIVRLGQGLGKTGKLHPDALMRADTCLKKFSELIQSHKVDQIQAVATAAAREAENSIEFTEICKKHQIPLVTLSGEEEAIMSFQGAIGDQENKKVLLIDIGGGSTEYIVGKRGSIELAKSLPYGAVKLTEKWIESQPVPDEQEKNLRQFIKTRTEELWAQIESLKPEKIWAVAGTPTALATATIGIFDAKKIDSFRLTKNLLHDWIQKLKGSTVEEKRQKYGFGDRADVIFAGSVILDELLKRTNKDEIFVSTKGIRYGLAYKMARTIF
jgi:exopolyphosphatase/guanosine-5'-triphosphate,3'-diphosphate pyrophosphatase